MKKALFIAYNFPPHGGAGVQRSTKFVKYLPEFEWQPIVVTSPVDASLVLDPSLLDDVPPDTPIFRVPGFSIQKLQRQAKQVGLGKVATALNLLLQIPDASRFWAKNVFKMIGDVIHTQKPEVVYTTSVPYSSHLAGLWIKQKFGLPWFADFRDPWSKNLLTPYLPGYHRFNRYLERKVLAAADRVACVSKPWLDDLQQNLGREKGKFIILPNGYDPADIEVTPIPVNRHPFTITHLGSLYRYRRPDKFIEALQQLINSGRVVASDLRVLFIGKNIQKYVPSQPFFEVKDYVPHKELSQFRQQTHVNLLILA
ncbi:MAG: glycosyltransferase, partial [Chloroflexota bacterium]|nr:glycosyltransferase [Chloroflexota bacterium]